MIIRKEQREDIGAISSVIDIAFTDHPHTTNNESTIVNKLRNTRKLSLSLVATKNGEIVGHVGFSRIFVNSCDYDWFGLAPLSVLPNHQGCGIGETLVRRGIEELQKSGAKGCVLLGNPEYYARFGFKHDDELILPGVPQSYFLALAFSQFVPHGNASFDRAFDC